MQIGWREIFKRWPKQALRDMRKSPYKCPDCGGVMYYLSGHDLLSFPPQYVYGCFECGCRINRLDKTLAEDWEEDLENLRELYGGEETDEEDES